MTRKDYTLIAQAFQKEIDACYNYASMTAAERRTWHNALFCVASTLADSLQVDNDRFDRDRFLSACLGENAMSLVEK